MIREYDGMKPKVAETAYVDESAVVSGQVELHDHVGVWCNVTIRGDMGRLVVGENSNVQDNAVLHCDMGGKINIGKGVTIGHSAIVHGAEIGDNAMIGMGAIVLEGAKIGENSIIGAGALVAEGKEIPPNSVVVGVPGKIVREVSEEEIQANIRNGKDYVILMEQTKEDLGL